MNRNPYLKGKRKKFIKLCDTDIKAAAKELREQAEALEKLDRTRDKVFALSQIFFISESTVEKDLYS